LLDIDCLVLLSRFCRYILSAKLLIFLHYLFLLQISFNPSHISCYAIFRVLHFQTSKLTFTTYLFIYLNIAQFMPTILIIIYHYPSNSSLWIVLVNPLSSNSSPIEVRSLAEVKEFSSSLCVQTGSEAHPHSCTICTGGVLSTRLKHGRGVKLTTHPHLVPKSRMNRSYYLLSPKRLRGV
jgi:hypothetical protein